MGSLFNHNIFTAKHTAENIINKWQVIANAKASIEKNEAELIEKQKILDNKMKVIANAKYYLERDIALVTKLEAEWKEAQKPYQALTSPIKEGDLVF